jgi:TolB protein
MSVSLAARAWACGVVMVLGGACAAQTRTGAAMSPTLEIVGAASLFAPGIASTEFADIRLTLSPDGQTALWFSRNRPGGPGGYDIWMSKLTPGGWSTAAPVSFNSAQRDFDPAFSPDGRQVYFCSDRAGGLGGDDIYRVAVTPEGFGQPELLGAQVNSPGNEWAPMLSADRLSTDRALLLFSSNGRGGAGRFDLFTARRSGNEGFEPAVPLPGEINTAADEFDATFLSDNATIVFAQSRDLQVDTVHLFYASRQDGRYGAGARLSERINTTDKSTYGPMLDWSRPDRITFSSQRPEAHAGSADLYVVRYRLIRKPTSSRNGSARVRKK